MNYNKIKTLASERKITLKELCLKIDISEQGLHKMVGNNSIKVSYLEKIAEVLEVPISYFFEEESVNISNNRNTIIGNKNQNINNNVLADIEKFKAEIEALQKEIDYLKIQIQDKEEIINLLKR